MRLKLKKPRWVWNRIVKEKNFLARQGESSHRGFGGRSSDEISRSIWRLEDHLDNAKSNDSVFQLGTPICGLPQQTQQSKGNLMGTACAFSTPKPRCIEILCSVELRGFLPDATFMAGRTGD